MLGFPDGAAVRHGACHAVWPPRQCDVNAASVRRQCNERAVLSEQAMYTSDGV